MTLGSKFPRPMADHPLFGDGEDAPKPQARKRKQPVKRALISGPPETRDQPARRVKPKLGYFSQFFNAEDLASPDNFVEDPNYTPRAVRRFKRNLLKLMGAATSPVKKALVVANTPHKDMRAPRINQTQVDSPSRYQGSSPGKRPSSFISPVGKTRYTRVRDLSLDDEEDSISLYLPEHKASKQFLSLPAVPNLKAMIELNIKAGSPMFDLIKDVPITLEQLDSIEEEKVRDKDLGLSERYPSQTSVYGCSPNHAAKVAGIDLAAAAKSVAATDANIMHICHFVGHKFLGNRGQIIQNFGLGTKYFNAEMTLLEDVLRKILQQPNTSDTLYVHVQPKYKRGYEDIRLIDELVYTITDCKFSEYQKDTHHKVSMKFFGLSLNKVCLTEQPLIADLLVKKFQQSKKQPESPPLTQPLVFVPLYTDSASRATIISSSPYKPPRAAISEHDQASKTDTKPIARMDL